MQIRVSKKYWHSILIGWMICCSSITTPFAAPFENRASYKVYFTPSDNCTTQITDAISAAHKSIYMHAYSLTSKPIVDALVKAHQRRVSVNIIIDKSNLAGDSKAKLLAKQGVSVWVDNLSGLAHNKVIITDQEQVITGSFNFSHAAQYKNRENILIIKDKNLTKLYLENWHRCKQKSTQLKYSQSKTKHMLSRIKQSPREKNKNIFMALVACVAIGVIILLQ